ncbi:hypothetical protein [Mycobacterium sp.]|jgi:hypothetical protein|uniref:hypothetical protein n=1 Tax=Mycobacterium sp. TaxID=1785 RepID=UPI002D23A0D6|nr:hypothetical protein [Mycobacterium sp.]HZA11902.1 hypothetical protein [Mycobacterium sp.]
MRSDTSRLIAAMAAVLSLALVTGCQAKVHGHSLGRHDAGPHVMAPGPMARTEPPPDAPPAMFPGRRVD